MKYMLLIYGDDTAMEQATPEQGQAVADEYDVFTQSIRKSGNFLDGDPFLPTKTATTVAASGTTSGPAVSGTPHLQAYYKVEADGPEAAIGMAKRVPGAKYGSVEVRQIVQYD